MRAFLRSAWALAAAAGLAVACGGGGGGGGGGTGTPDPRLERYDAGFFSVDKPRGWTVATAGSCETLAFLLQDPAAPLLRQVFYFGTVGKLYTSAAQKALDEYYEAHGGYPIPWIDAPVVDPFTPSNFLAHWPAIADMQGAAAFMAAFPHLEGLELVSSVARPTMLAGVAGSATGEARGVFRAGAKVGEGMFLATVVGPSALSCPNPASPDNPSACTGNGHFVCGVTAGKETFTADLDLLVASLNTFTITQAYVDQCIAQAQREWGAVAAAGRTLSEASDVLWDGWVARTHAEDVTAEEYRDGFLGVERVYDPETREVYEVPVGWYETYDANRGSYSQSGLEPLPGDAAYWDLWTKAPADGSVIH
jgi:hypothetical protein